MVVGSNLSTTQVTFIHQRLLELVLGSEAAQVVHKVRLQRHMGGFGCLALGAARKQLTVVAKSRFRHPRQIQSFYSNK